jgi:F-type H+-transporting ATPase subunit b
MSFFLFTVILLSAAAEHGSGQPSAFSQFFNKYLNYPGFELWKFINLGLFIAALVYLVKKPMTDSFKARREVIRAELIKAEQDKAAALADLTAAEAKLAGLDTEKASIMKRAKEEAAAEEANIARNTEHEIAKLHQQAESEIGRLTQQSKAELRRYSAEESVRLAEEKLRGRINADNDADLVRSGIQSIGGLS